jgi:hypothetical protein
MSNEFKFPKGVKCPNGFKCPMSLNVHHSKKMNNKESVQRSIILLAIPVSAPETTISATILIRLRQNV